MIEKTFTFDSIAPQNFLGVANRTIKELEVAFPKTKIISRGNEITLQGETSEVIRLTDILESLLLQAQRIGYVTEQDVRDLITHEKPLVDSSSDDVIVYGDKGVAIKAKTVNQQKMVQAVKQKDLLFVMGPAGTGKTFISVALAVRALKNKEVRKIIITRPAVEAGENLGFLPGDLQEKISPYLRPIYDALHELIPSEKLAEYQAKGIIEIAPLAYMRGRTLHHAFILLDEAQNTTPMQMKMFLTRMGPESKMIVTGDITQIDLPERQKSGLQDALTMLQHISDIGIVELSDRDVMRHSLVRQIISAYQKK